MLMWKVHLVSWNCAIVRGVEVSAVIVSAPPCEVRSKVGPVPNPSRSLRVESLPPSPIHAPSRAPQGPRNALSSGTFR